MNQDIACRAIERSAIVVEPAANEMAFGKEKSDQVQGTMVFRTMTQSFHSKDDRGTDAREDSQVIILHCETYQ